jgi:LmbE family N-acetylglucosaminyl deacetylase
MTTLVVMAHPDDETLGAGGTIARLTTGGERVAWLLLGDGVGSRAAPGPVAAERRRAHCMAAAAILGVHDVECHDLPDNRMDGVDLLDVVALVEATVARVAPETVITHHGGDLNVDHRVTRQAVLTATRPLPGATVRTVLGAEVPSSTEWSFGAPDHFRPSVFVDVSDTVGAKLSALACYEDELRPVPHARSVEAVRALATTRGATTGVAAAEAFELIRAVR